MMLREIRPHLLVALALLILGPAAHARVSVEVATRCDVKDMNSHYGYHMAHLLDQLRSNLLQNLQARPQFGYWTFAAERAPGSSKASEFQFVFSIIEPVAKEIRLQLEYRTPTIEPQSWQLVWIKPGQLEEDGYPLVGHAPRKLADGFVQLLDSNISNLRMLLQESTPLAVGGHWDTETQDLRIVLPLQWDRYSKLRRSEFRVACTFSPKALEPEGELFSYGIGQPREYEEEDQKRYPALAVVPRSWQPAQGEKQPIEQILDRVRNFFPKLAFLHREVPPGLTLDIFEEAP